MEDPLGAYLVDYMTYDCAEGVNCYEITVRLTYQKTPAQLHALVNATTTGAIPELLDEALRAGQQELAVKVGYMDASADAIGEMVARCMAETTAGKRTAGRCSIIPTRAARAKRGSWRSPWQPPGGAGTAGESGPGIAGTAGQGLLNGREGGRENDLDLWTSAIKENIGNHGKKKKEKEERIHAGAASGGSCCFWSL